MLRSPPRLNVVAELSCNLFAPQVEQKNNPKYLPFDSCFF
jgi:hypothetical protein